MTRKKVLMDPVSPEMSALLDDLKKYCEEKRGRKAQVARTLGILASGLSNFLAKRSEPRELARFAALLVSFFWASFTSLGRITRAHIQL